MTNRQRTYNLLHFKDIDRMPAVHFGYWKELLDEWAKQGHIGRDVAENWADGNEVDKELDKILGWDFNWYRVRGGNMGLCPAFERKIIEILPDGFKRIQNESGIIERIRDGAGSIPAEDDYLLKDRASFEELYKPKMQFLESRIDEQNFVKVCSSEKDDEPVGLNLGSLIGDIRNMLSVMGLSYMIYDDYELLREIVNTYADMQYKVVEKVLKTGVKFDFGHYWEDICFKNGPLIAPSVFEELCAEHYRKRNELCNSYGIDIISLDCDGVTEKLLPVWFENGVNTMFPIEVGTWGDQFEAARIKFGSRMRGVGGVDKTVFLHDKEAVDREIDRVKRLIALGGYIPCPDHRLMPGTKWDLLLYYIDNIKKIRP